MKVWYTREADTIISVDGYMDTMKHGLNDLPDAVAERILLAGLQTGDFRGPTAGELAAEARAAAVKAKGLDAPAPAPQDAIPAKPMKRTEG